MFVSNHNSWMDIPFIGHTIGWHNYKFVAKKELEKVPILGKAIMLSKNVCVDRSDRKSQLMTLKQGMKWLEVSSLYCFYCGENIDNKHLMYQFMNILHCRMESTSALSPKAHDHAPTVSCPLWVEHSKWPKRQEPP